MNRRKPYRRIRARFLWVRRSVRSSVRRVVRNLLSPQTRAAYARFGRLSRRLNVAYKNWVAAKTDRDEVYSRNLLFFFYFELLRLNLKIGVVRCSSV
jgi:hypothetical protein